MGGVAVPTMKQRDDPLTTVMKGLQIAQSAFGIKEAVDKSAAVDQAKEDQKRGVISPVQRLELSKTHQEVSPDTPNAIKMIGRDEKGDEFPLAYVLRPKAGETKTRQVETIGADGKPEIRIVEDKPGASYPAYQKPKEDKSSEQATTLRKEYDSHPTTKATGQLLSAHDKVMRAATNPNPTAATDMALSYGVMKMFDPTTGVKEGEYASAENTRGVPDSVLALYERARTGHRLTDEQIRSFLKEADNIMVGQLELQKQQDTRFGGYATRNGVDPGQVIDPTFARAAQQLEARMKQTPTAPVAGSVPQNPNEIGLPKPKGTANAAPQGGATPGSVIELKTHPGKRFVVGADGETLTEIK